MDIRIKIIDKQTVQYTLHTLSRVIPKLTVIGTVEPFNKSKTVWFYLFKDEYHNYHQQYYPYQKPHENIIMRKREEALMYMSMNVNQYFARICGKYGVH